MKLAKLGALTALGAVLALPAVAQTSYQGMQGPNGGYNQAMNTETGTTGWPGINESSGLGRQSQSFEGGGYASSGNGGNFGRRQYGSGNGGQYGQYANGPEYGHGNGSQYGQHANGRQYGNGNGGQYGQYANGPQYGNGNGGQYGQNGMGMRGNWSNRRLVSHEVFALRGALEQAGFSHIRVLPEAFLVRAMDREGHHVLMLVSPNSIQEMMAFNPGQGRGMGQGMMNRGMMSQGMMSRGGMNSGMAGGYGPNGGMNGMMGNR